MANNRLFLIHRPTGLSVLLAKRMAWGWYTTSNPRPVEMQLDKLFDMLHTEASQDDFGLAIEDATEAPACVEIVEYDVPKEPFNGIRRLKIKS